MLGRDDASRIRQLPSTVVSQIQAGEVIERPASVVKELLENSLDAGSTRIEVDVENGGLDRIRVVDNGWGIFVDDLVLAFASHATSKLPDADDLVRIGSLGFRGEALASIGGVAQVSLQSRRAVEPFGHEISCHGGELSPIRVWNGSPGTRLDVKHLFFNVPPRRKFLRSASTEMGHVCETFTRLALSHTAVHWVLRHHNKMVYELPATAGLVDRIGLFFGAEVRDKLYAIENGHGHVRLTGFIADPSCDRGNAKMQYLFVNGRWVRDRSIGHAVQEAFRGLLMTGRYAVTFLFLEVPSETVDVNVHPTKAEVRFRDGQSMYHLVFGTLRERLRRENLTARLQAPPTPLPPPSPELPFTSRVPPPPPVMSPPRPVAEQFPTPSLPETSAEPTPTPPAFFKAIQLYDTYLVVETNEGMLVIDQHALHERIMFEQLKSRFRQGTLDKQRLLIPEPVDLTAEQAARTLEQRAALDQLGLEVEDFGGGTVLVTAYPAIMARRKPGEVLKVVVDHLMSQDRLPTREVLLNDLLSLMACHAAVRAGDRLTPDEIAALVEQRALADDTHHCPHGRPTALLFSKHELERQFRRI